MRHIYLGWFLFSGAVAASAQTTTRPSAGIPLNLARERAARIHDLRYDIRLDIPETKTDRIRGEASITFTLTEATKPVVLDFASDPP